MKNQVHPITRKIIYTAFFCLNLFVSIFRYFIFPDQPFVFHVALFAISFLGFMAIWEFILFLNRVLEKPYPIATRPSFIRVLQLFATFVVVALLGDFLFNTASKIFDVQIPALLNTVAFLLFFLISLILNLSYFGGYYFSQWKENLVRSERLQREHAQVKYDALRNQLNPHFLFNALTSLNSLIFENQQLASDFLQQLSKVYRYTLEHKDKETVSVKTELDFISKYIFLFKTRFEKAIDFKIELNEEAKSKSIVPVTLQLLIENAAKHNIITNEKPLIISISADDDYLKVENTINKKSLVETSNNQGLVNLKTLYQYLSDRPIEIIETEKLFTVKIPLIDK